MSITDADIEMAELAEAGNMAYAGVCSLCEDVLDPFHPKWAGKLTLGGEVMTPAEYAEGLGPVHAQLPWHVECMRANDIPL